MGCRTDDRIGWVATLCPTTAKDPVAASGSYGEPRMYIRGKGCRERDDACAGVSGSVSALGVKAADRGPEAWCLGRRGRCRSGTYRRGCHCRGHSFPLLQLRGHGEGGVRDRRIGFLGFRQRNETNGQSSSLMA